MAKRLSETDKHLASIADALEISNRTQDDQSLAGSIRNIGNAIFVGLVLTQAFYDEKDLPLAVIGFITMIVSYRFARRIGEGGVSS